MTPPPVPDHLLAELLDVSPQAAASRLAAWSPEAAVDALRTLPLPQRAQIVEYLDPQLVLPILANFPVDAIVEIVERLPTSAAADLLRHLPDPLRRDLLGRLPPTTRTWLDRLASYPENSAGRILDPEVLAFPEEATVQEVVTHLRSRAEHHLPLTYAYVANPQGRLVGVLTMRDLLLANAGTPIATLARREVFSVPARMDREDVARHAAARRFLAIPVVDDDGRLLGTIKSDDLLTHVQEEATEDLQKLFGAGAEEHVFSPLRFSLRKRLPWLHVNLATAFLAAWVVSLFEPTIAKLTVLAVFLPIVAGEGGNTGIQSLAVVMRGLVLHHVSPRQARQVLLRQGLLGLTNGLVIGVVTGLLATAWHAKPFLGVVIGLAMVINMVVACVAGAGIPLMLRRVGMDPAQSSGIMLTTVTDIVGFLAFLGLATVFQHALR